MSKKKSLSLSEQLDAAKAQYLQETKEVETKFHEILIRTFRAHFAQIVSEVADRLPERRRLEIDEAKDACRELIDKLTEIEGQDGDGYGIWPRLREWTSLFNDMEEAVLARLRQQRADKNPNA